MTQLFDIGRSALTTYQAALTTVSRNVANVNTPGYARQSVQFGQRIGGGGVEVIQLSRAADNSALQSARSAISENAGAQARADALSRIDARLSDDATGLAEPLRALTTAVSQLSARPTDPAAREALLRATDDFAAQVQSLDANLRSEADQATSQLGSLVRGAQNQLEELALVQQRLEEAPVLDAAAATLADQRDVLLEGLAETLGVQSRVNADGSLQIGLANGQPLLEAGQPARLGLGTNALGELELTVGGVGQPRRIVGGEAGGLLQLLDEDIPAAQDALGRIAAGVADVVNANQTAGAALDGSPGQALFDSPQPRVRPASDNAGAGTLTAQRVDLGAVPDTRFTLEFDGANWSASGADGQALALAGTGAAGDPLRVGGLELTLSGGAAAGDRFVVEPAVAGQIAARPLDADALATAPAGSAANSGDNAQIIALADALAGGLFDGGRSSLQQVTNTWVSATGEAAAAAQSRADVTAAARDFAVDRRDAIQGVNLDEEAADLLRYEKAYQAAAQVLATAGSLFDSVLAAVRR